MRDTLADSEFATASLEFHEQAVISIENEIDTLSRTIRQLQFRKMQHSDRIKRAKGLTTLARKLPPELLAYIFEECVRDGWTRTPLTASHVCREWRKAAQIPTVWSHIYVNCAARDPCGRTRFWLENAQNSPLHITVRVTDDGLHLPEVMGLLSARAAQWRVMTVDSSLLRHIDYILTSCNQHALGLHTINISISEEFEEDGNAENGVQGLALTRFSLAAPHIRTLRISWSILPSPSSIPASITALSITLYTHSNSSVDRALHLLEGLPGLQELSIALPHDQARVFESASSDRIVSLLDLRVLALVGSTDMFKLLGHFSTPSLSRLHLRSSMDPTGYPDEETGSNVRNFIERETPPLELLELHDIDLSPSNFTACFANLPGLKRLHLHESDITDSIIGLFMSSRGLCPLLDRLDLRWCSQVTGKALVTLVQDRIANSSRENGTWSSLINMITVINCASVKVEEVWSLSQSTICRIIIQPDDYCCSKGDWDVARMKDTVKDCDSMFGLEAKMTWVD